MTQKKKPKFTKVSGIPCWAASYFANADSSGLDDEDKKRVTDYEKRLLKEGLKLVYPIEGTRNEFNPCPAFGLACNTVDFTAEVLPPDRIVFRKYWNKWNKAWTPIAFLPDVEANRGNIMSYEHMGQHCEACMGYYRSTKPCEPELYASLLEELKSIGYRPRVMKRITRPKNRMTITEE
jgi:hypothetical protein